MSTLTATTKRCTKCRSRKLLTEFGLHTGRRDGRQSWCKACHRTHIRGQRAVDPDRKDYDAKQAQSYRAAMRRLREAHRAEFDRYYADELAMRGLA